MEMRDEVLRPKGHLHDSEWDKCLSGSLVSALHTETISGLTQQCTTTESLATSWVFPLKAFTPKFGLHPTLPGDDLNRAQTLRPGQTAM